jgi:hypothetical protein
MSSKIRVKIPILQINLPNAFQISSQCIAVAIATHKELTQFVICSKLQHI